MLPLSSSRPQPPPSAHTQRYIDAAEHRYVLSCKVADPSGETYVNLFNAEVPGGRGGERGGERGWPRVWGGRWWPSA
jgi:hypothetical protein